MKHSQYFLISSNIFASQLLDKTGLAIFGGAYLLLALYAVWRND